MWLDDVMVNGSYKTQGLGSRSVRWLRNFIYSVSENSEFFSAISYVYVCAVYVAYDIFPVTALFNLNKKCTLAFRTVLWMNAQ